MCDLSYVHGNAAGNRGSIPLRPIVAGMASGQFMAQPSRFNEFLALYANYCYTE
jgi:hypothetical protein